MTWLTGQPQRARTILWPADDPDLADAVQYLNTPARRDDTHVLDDRLLHYIYLRLPHPRTLLYLVDLRDSGDGPLGYRRLATLPFGAHRLVLLPGRSGFATLQFIKSESTVTLRIHAEDGSVSRQIVQPASAAYGRFVASGSLLAVCISSGTPVAPTHQALVGNPDYLCRVDATDGSRRDFPLNLVGDQLLVWDTAKEDSVVRVNIPQDPKAPMQHSGSFAVVDGQKIALAGFLPAQFGMNSAHLKVFPLDATAANNKTFTHGRHPGKPLGILRDVAPQGSSAESDIVVHSHHAGARLSVFHKDLLVGLIQCTASSRDPPGLIEARRYASHIRTNSVFLAGPHAAHVGDRVLALAESTGPPHVVLLDFARPTLQALLALDDAQRTALRGTLGRAGGCVQVVTRRFIAPARADDEAEDAEYLWPRARPDAWTTHLRALYERDEARRLAGDTDVPPLEYDERPEEHRAVHGLAYVQTRLALPKDVDRARLALTAGAVLELPVVGKEGRAFYFEEGLPLQGP